MRPVALHVPMAYMVIAAVLTSRACTGRCRQHHIQVMDLVGPGQGPADWGVRGRHRRLPRAAAHPAGRIPGLAVPSLLGGAACICLFQHACRPARVCIHAAQIDEGCTLHGAGLVGCLWKGVSVSYVAT